MMPEEANLIAMNEDISSKNHQTATMQFRQNKQSGRQKAKHAKSGLISPAGTACPSALHEWENSLAEKLVLCEFLKS
jgi:hypothetical protein